MRVEGDQRWHAGHSAGTADDLATLTPETDAQTPRPGDAVPTSARPRPQATAPVARSLAIRSASNPAAASTSSVCWPAWGGGAAISGAVRLKRGAGPGCGT